MGRFYVTMDKGKALAFYDEAVHGPRMSEVTDEETGVVQVIPNPDTKIPPEAEEITREQRDLLYENSREEVPIPPTPAMLARVRLQNRPLGVVTPAAFEDLLIALKIK